MYLFTLFLKSEKRSGFVFANTCYQKDINPVIPEKNKTSKDNFTESQDTHGLFDTTDCTGKKMISGKKFLGTEFTITGISEGACQGKQRTKSKQDQFTVLVRQ